MKLPDLDAYEAGVLSADRATVGRALTLVESDHPVHHRLAQELLRRLGAHTGSAIRLGITGVPGVGKSTLIDVLGQHLLELGHRVAVLAVDPTSGRSGGSILGDKTRMAALARDDRAFIRPSPSRGALGGVARKTRESMLICEAAGYDIVIVETVGVGQSETQVADMVDCFLVLMLANAGDELQGIKRGILELADLIAVNKADGDNVLPAKLARQQYDMAIRLLGRKEPSWEPQVLTVSARTQAGVPELWAGIEAHRATLEGADRLAALRSEQAVSWMWRAVQDELSRRLRTHPRVMEIASGLEAEVRAGTTPATEAAVALLDRFSGGEAADDQGLNRASPERGELS